MAGQALKRLWEALITPIKANRARTRLTLYTGAQHARETLDKKDDDDEIQEIYTELEQAEARIDELEAKLAMAVAVAEKSIGWLRLYGADVHKESTTLAELKGQDDE